MDRNSKCIGLSSKLKNKKINEQKSFLFLKKLFNTSLLKTKIILLKKEKKINFFSFFNKIIN